MPQPCPYYPPSYHYPAHNCNGPSRLCRCERREAVCKDAAEETHLAEEVIENETAEDPSHKKQTEEVQNNNTMLKIEKAEDNNAA